MARSKRVKETTSTASKTTPKETSWTFISVQLFLISLLVVVLSYYLLRSTTPQQEQPTFNHTTPVPVKILTTPSSKFAQSCAEAGVPVIFKNSISTQWKAMQWTPDYLEKKINIITGVYENTNRWFGPYFDKQKPLLSYAERVNKYKTNLKLSSKEFFKRIQTYNSEKYLYFTGDIDQLGDWAIDEIQPFEELLTLNPSHSSINAWIGQPHVIAHCHYDGYHNFYAQLYGKKRFLLLRPTNWPGLYPYPFLHPSHAQAQVNASNESDRRHFQLVNQVEAYEAILEPGDLLYVPPLWFHEVESLKVSISVNVWTDSSQTQTAERLFQLPLPIHSKQWTSERAKVIATSFLLFQTLQNICTHRLCARSVTDKFKDGFQDEGNPLSDTRAVYFVHRLWSTRYRTLMDREKLPNTLPGNILCEVSSIGEEVDEAKMAAHSSEFGDYAKIVGELVQELPGDTWELWVGNYVEFVVANAVPEVELVGVFLKQFSTCLMG